MKELVFTAYNRPNYFREVVQSWNNVRNLPMWQTTVHLEPSEVQNEMSELALSLNTQVGIIINTELQGVLTNPWNALDAAFSRGADFVILAEDDVIVSQDVLEYFEWCSIEYQTAYNVLTVNAFSQIGGGKPGHITTEDPKFSPLIWGTWRDRWENYLRDTWDKDYSTGNPDGSEAGWDWNINRIIQNNGFTVVKPLQSRADHIGQYFGTHMIPELFDSSRGVDFSPLRNRTRYIEV